MAPPQKPNIRAASNEIAMVSVKKRKFPMYLLQDSELKTLENGFVSVNFALFGIFFGTGITLLLTAHILPSEDKWFPWCWEGSIFSGVLVLYFGIAAFKDWWKSKKEVEKIRESEVETEIEYAVTEKINQIKPGAQS